ncbi:hypothetical protein DL98DRAFT_638236 [Cadophora sp. DSE1049]|nr:hypothetical protein DL98DRAFT_638236 [Cadophora sp. DSE1049]
MSDGEGHDSNHSSTPARTSPSVSATPGLAATSTSTSTNTSSSAAVGTSKGRGRDQGGRSFLRTYVACNPCRSRKVKCVIGSEPPCAKCAREHRDCVFTNQKQAGKRRELPSWAAREVTPISTRTEVPRQFSTSPQSSSQDQSRSRTENVALFQQPEMVNTRDVRPTDEHSGISGTDPRATSAYSASHLSPASTQSDNQRLRQSGNILSDHVVRTVVAKSTDALDLLFNAAQDQSDNYATTNIASAGHNDQQAGLAQNNAASGSQSRPTGLPAPNMNTPSFAGIPSSDSGIPVPPAVSNLSYPVDDVLDTWGKCRFVAQGWFTAQEAVTYVDLFFQNMSDLSPILPQSVGYHENHYRLICEEPMLCTTILMISSRYHTLPGVGGISRGYYIHQRLWHHCEHLLQRVMLGQEKTSSAKTRTLGTIESFLLISEWNPRAILFPPDTDGWDAQLLSNRPEPRHRLLVQDQSSPARWREDVFLPAKRSDCMSWMLVGAATNLASELGVFTESRSGATPNISPRHARIQKLIFVYVNQIATRLGCASLLPQNILHLVSGSSQLEPVSTADHHWGVFMERWIEITKLMKTSLALLFPSAAISREMILDGRYITLLQHFAPSLSAWYSNFVAIKDLPKPFEDILCIEYHYVKAYVNSLSIQAVVERALARGVNNPNGDQGDLFQTCIDPEDYNFINEVTTSSRYILQRATALVQSGTLKYTPMRILLRIASASLFLLKSISLGGRNIDLQVSLHILDESNAALRATPLDDMDVASRYATLLERHTARFRKNFTVSRQPAFGYTMPSYATNPEIDGMSNSQYSTADLYNTQLLPENGMDGWSAQPFDPSIAPFAVEGDQMYFGFDDNSLDFLWNTPSW